jgi:hypothetical protein
MRIIKLAKADRKSRFGPPMHSERRLAAFMFCVENGARVVDDDGKALKAPHAPFPEIKVDPRTEQGLPVIVTYKPAVGIIFYSAGSGFSARALAARLRDQMDVYGDAHLRGHRSVAVTPCATLRHKPHVVPGTELVGPRVPYQKRPAEDAKEVSARSILFTPPDYCDIPSHVGYRSVFTWIIMNGAPSIGLKMTSMADFNAVVASAFYDTAGILSPSLEDGSDTMSVTAEDLSLPQPPDDIRDALSTPRKGNEALLIDRRTGIITVVGDANTLTMRRPADLPRLDEKWGSSPNANIDLKELSCLVCGVPLYGDVVLIKAPLEPRQAADIDAWPPVDMILQPGANILGGRSAAICRFCYQVIPECAINHLRCTLVRSKIQRDQAAALRGSDLQHLVPVVTAGQAVPVPGTVGVFSVGEKFLIAPPARPFMEIGFPELMATELPVLRYPALAELSAGA